MLLKHVSDHLCMTVPLIKLKALTYTKNKEKIKLYTKVYDSIADNNFQTDLKSNNQTILADGILILYPKPTSYNSYLDKNIQVTLLLGSNSIDDFNAKINAATLR